LKLMIHPSHLIVNLIKTPQVTQSTPEVHFGGPKRPLSNPKAGLHPKKEHTSPILFALLPLCALSVLARSQT